MESLKDSHGRIKGENLFLASLTIGLPVMIVMMAITLVLTLPTMLFILGRAFYFLLTRYFCP